MQPEDMSLRDYFAGQALSALPLLVRRDPEGRRPAERVAFAAFDIADAMLAQREKDGKRHTEKFELMQALAEIYESLGAENHEAALRTIRALLVSKEISGD